VTETAAQLWSAETCRRFCSLNDLSLRQSPESFRSLTSISGRPFETKPLTLRRTTERGAAGTTSRPSGKAVTSHRNPHSPRNAPTLSGSFSRIQQEQCPSKNISHAPSSQISTLSSCHVFLGKSASGLERCVSQSAQLPEQLAEQTGRPRKRVTVAETGFNTHFAPVSPPEVSVRHIPCIVGGAGVN